MKISHQAPGTNELSTQKTNQKGLNADKADGSREQVENASFRLNKNRIDKIKNRIEAEPDVRADRVAELKAKIKNGEYQVDSTRLADRMIRSSIQEDMAAEG